MKIGVAGTDQQKEENWIMEELVSRDQEAVFVDPAEVSYLLSDGEVRLRQHGDTLHDLDLLFMRRTRFDVEASRDLIAALDTLGVRTIERKEVFYNPLSKFYSLLSFVGESINGVNIPSTAIIREKGEAGVLADEVGYPLIMKPIAGREGEGVDRLDSREDLEAALQDAELPVLIQEYLKIEQEYRILVVGDEALGTVMKEGGEGVTRNFAQGAEFIAVEKPALEAAAVEIAQTMGIEVAGVDIVETAGGEAYEIECNRCPQFKGFASAHEDVDVPAKIVDYLLEQAG